MNNKIKKIWVNHSFLAYSSLASILLLTFFFILQISIPEILKLDTKWIIVAVCPLMYALIVGGYIKRFKGFGLELETQLKTAIAESLLLATDSLIELPEDEKKSNQYLDSLTNEERNRIERLTFYSGRQGYYSMYVVRHFLENLPNLKFLEVRNENGIFGCLLPINSLRKKDIYHREINLEIDESRLVEFIQALENNDIVNKYTTDVIAERVIETDPLIDILPKVRKQRSGILGVVDNSGKLIGILNKSMVEAKIADEVLNARRRSKGK